MGKPTEQARVTTALMCLSYHEQTEHWGDFMRRCADAAISEMRAMDREKAQSRDRHQQEVWGGKGGPM